MPTHQVKNAGAPLPGGLWLSLGLDDFLQGRPFPQVLRPCTQVGSRLVKGACSQGNGRVAVGCWAPPLSWGAEAGASSSPPWGRSSV